MVTLNPGQVIHKIMDRRDAAEGTGKFSGW